MNLRFWSSWFIIVAFFTVALTIGCEKGSLGVKPATVIGKLVDASDPSIPIANGLIRMIGKEAVGTADLLQVNTFASVVSDANGNFIFENVTPDNVLFQFTAQGYLGTTYPETVKSESVSGADDTGDTSTSVSASEEIESVAIRSGAMVNLHIIKMKKSTVLAKGKVNVKLDLVDKITKQAVANDLYFMASINSITYSMTASDWRNIGAEIDASSGVDVVLTNTDGIYLPYKSADDVGSYKFTSDAYQRLELEPLSFEFCIRTVNVPDHLTDMEEKDWSKLNIFAEIAGTIPAQIIATNTIDMPVENATTFFSIPLSNAQNGLRIRIQLRGYEDIIADIPADKFSVGTEGTYRLDIDFKKVADFDPNSADWVQGAYGKIKWRRCQFSVYPVLAGQTVGVIVSLPSKNGLISPDYTNQVVNVFMDIASGYKMSYDVYRDGAAVASSPVDGVWVNVENSDVPSTLVYPVSIP